MLIDRPCPADRCVCCVYVWWELLPFVTVYYRISTAQRSSWCNRWPPPSPPRRGWCSSRPLKRQIELSASVIDVIDLKMSHKSIHLIVKNDTNSDHQIINFPNFDLSMRIRRFQPAPTLGPTPTEWRSALADTYPFVMTIQVYNILHEKYS